MGLEKLNNFLLVQGLVLLSGRRGRQHRRQERENDDAECCYAVDRLRVAFLNRSGLPCNFSELFCRVESFILAQGSMAAQDAVQTCAPKLSSHA